MKILYLTLESYYREAIIKSQVEQLLVNIIKEDDVEKVLFTTFDKVEKASVEIKCPDFYHKIFKHRGTFLNIVILIWFVIRHAKEYDIIHVRSYMPMFAAIVAKLFFQKKIIFDPRGLFADELAYHGRFILARIFKMLEYVLYKFSDVIIVVSHPFKDYIISKYRIDAEHVKVIPTFSIKKEQISVLESNNFRTALRWEDDLIFVYSGAFEKWQLIDEVIQFFILLEKNIKNSKFVFFSRQKEIFVEYLDDKLDRDNYTVISVDSKELTSYLSLCDYGILFRDQDIINRVAAPIKVKDYLLAGLSVIMTDNIGDSSELVRKKDFGFILKDLSLEEMLRVIKEIQISSNVKSAKAIAAEVSLLFDVGVLKEKYYHLYKKIVRNS